MIFPGISAGARCSRPCKRCHSSHSGARVEVGTGETCMHDFVKYWVTDGIASITFNRPKVMNALNPETIVAFRGACEEVANDSKAKVVVLRGEGPAFLAGGDVEMFKRNLPRIVG